MHYVIGDVHGCYEELMDLMEKIEKADRDARIIFIGDLIDRGPEVDKVLSWAMQHITLDEKYQSVRGNHEQMVIESYQEFLEWCKMSDDILPIIQFFESLPYSKCLEVPTVYGKTVKFRIVHAWYRQDLPEDCEEQKQCNLWERERLTVGEYDSKEIIVHGHTPTIHKDYYLMGKDAPGMICYRKNAVNLDGGCCFGEKSSFAHNLQAYRPYMLCAICLENLEEIYPYSLEERFAQLFVDWEKALEDYKELFECGMDPDRQRILEKMGCSSLDMWNENVSRWRVGVMWEVHRGKKIGGWR